MPWPKYPLENQSKWPVSGTLYPDILRELCNILPVTRQMEVGTLFSSLSLSLLQTLSLFFPPIPLLSYEG